MPVDKMLEGALKPALEVAARGHLERFGEWIQKNSFEKQTSPERLGSILGNYWLKLSHQVSDVTSLAFPNRMLDLGKVYEPLSAVDPDDRTEVSSEQLAVSLCEHAGSYLVIDSGGMGKTTFAKHLVSKILFKKNRSPIFFELRRTSGNLKADLASELTVNGKQISSDLLNFLLDKGRLVLIFDGFDEVPINQQSSMADQIYQLSIEAPLNGFIVTSRPQDNIPTLSQQRTLNLNPLSVKQAASFLRRYDQYSGYEVGSKLTRQFADIPSEFLKSPLLLSLLYKTFGINQSIADKRSTFYDELYQALYKGHDSTNKNSYARQKKSELDFECFRTLLQGLCYLLALKSKVSFADDKEVICEIDTAIRLTQITPVSSEQYLDDLLVSVPLMHRDGTDLKFSHKSIVDYFAAEYLIRLPNSQHQLEKISNSPAAAGLTGVLEFIAETNSILFDTAITKKIAQKVLDLPEFEDRSAAYSALALGGFAVGLFDQNGPHVDHSNERFGPRLTVLGRFNLSTWRPCKVDGKDYLIAAFGPRVTMPLLPSILSSLAEIGSRQVVARDDADPLPTELLDALEKDKLMYLDTDLTRQISGHHPLDDLLNNCLMRHSRARWTFSLEKCTKFVAAAEENENFVKELDSLIP
jgi:hypothetical protein